VKYDDEDGDDDDDDDDDVLCQVMTGSLLENAK